MTDIRKLGLALAGLLVLPSIAIADDWTATRLFGPVQQLIDGQWQSVARGDAVPDGRVIRTVGLGRATFARGNETVEVGTNTQIQIFDEHASKPFTTVKQYFGTVSVEAEVQQVQHFAVQTPYLAAVVKGTRFTVTSGTTGASVSVYRGHVAVEDEHDHTHVLLAVGQSASVKTDGALAVSGEGTLPAVVPAKVKLATYTNTGYGSASDKGKSEKADTGNSGNGNSGNGNSGSGNSGNGNGNSGGGNGNSGSGSDNGSNGKDKKDG